ncbi:MAG: hypothetical protein IM586_18160 [Pseudanabaena sp. M172S2SP2A07QC]|jgi:hypothetical protein|nr:hypothetical protein [Pseudanabaena sp. M172S2SP2A07QC]MCA6510253.1 hypothetical protein [Pseudanabaena sp. M109S1SP2A07QC]MCA6546697.1 hypothetical protein [Pseudanabaena sp. M152S2SP2A07QC]
MLKSLDNSNGIQYYGGNDPAKMSGRFKKGGGRGVAASSSSARRSAVGQRSSVESRFGALAGNISKNQAILRNPNSTQQERDKAKRLISRNAALATTGTALRVRGNVTADALNAVRSRYFQ